MLPTSGCRAPRCCSTVALLASSRIDERPSFGPLLVGIVHYMFVLVAETEIEMQCVDVRRDQDMYELHCALLYYTVLGQYLSIHSLGSRECFG